MPQTIFTYESIFTDSILQLVTFSLPDNGPYTVKSIKFDNGIKKVDDLDFNPLAGVQDYSVIDFSIAVPVYICLKRTSEGGEVVLNECIPSVFARIVLYTPLLRLEMLPVIAVETCCQSVAEPVINSSRIQLVVNINMVVRLSATHQLAIPSVLSSRDKGDIPDFQSSSRQVYEKFTDPARTQFPSDFFPVVPREPDND